MSLINLCLPSDVTLVKPIEQVEDVSIGMTLDMSLDTAALESLMATLESLNNIKAAVEGGITADVEAMLKTSCLAPIAGDKDAILAAIEAEQPGVMARAWEKIKTFFKAIAAWFKTKFKAMFGKIEPLEKRLAASVEAFKKLTPEQRQAAEKALADNQDLKVFAAKTAWGIMDGMPDMVAHFTNATAVLQTLDLGKMIGDTPEANTYAEEILTKLGIGPEKNDWDTTEMDAEYKKMSAGVDSPSKAGWEMALLDDVISKLAAVKPALAGMAGMEKAAAELEKLAGAAAPTSTAGMHHIQTLVKLAQNMQRVAATCTTVAVNVLEQTNSVLEICINAKPAAAK